MDAVAVVPFKYDRPDYQLDRGEIFRTKDLINDAKLEGLGYYIEFDRSIHKKLDCDNCSRIFANETYLLGHRSKVNGCMSQEQEINRVEYAKLIDKDIDKVKIDMADPILPPG